MDLLPSPTIAALMAAAGIAAWFGLLGLMALATRSPPARRRRGPGRPPTRISAPSLLRSSTC